ncbi:MAG TPA: excisionase family DNA-binding protein [Terriglobia bacterium]|nr:excisionase family DNA-binding protein [Terriglobia bacterium]
MKNNGKNRFETNSYSVSEAAAALGVSTPTVKRMVAEGQLESYRTPGGHLRILAESIEAMREGKQRQPRPVRDASPVLQNRREQLEELTLETQEFRAKRELERLRREDEAEAERVEAEREAREEEAADRQAELELERRRLEHEREMAEERREREATQERQRREAEQQMNVFHSRWLHAAERAVTRHKYAWLSASQRKEVLAGLEAEIKRRQPGDEGRMSTILAHTLDALVEPLQAERKTQATRQSLTERALWNLPLGVTEAERVRARAAVREALGRFNGLATEAEMRVAAEEAIQPVRQAIERRNLEARLMNWAIWQLPSGKSDRDEARLRRECAEILAELPGDATEVEAKEALEPTVNEARQEIEQRKAQEQRQARKASLIEHGVAEVSSYLFELHGAGDISADNYWDTDFNSDLKEAVRRGLTTDLTGDETAKEVRELAREIMDESL